MALNPRESAKLIAGSTKNVFIEEKGVQCLARKVFDGLNDGTISINNFSQCELHPNSKHPRAIDWIFVLDTLNFCFWNSNNQTKWKVNGQSGYFALCAAIKRAHDEGIPIVDPKYYANITKDDFEKILRGDIGTGTIPLLDERLQCIQEVGTILVEKYNGSFVECVKSSEHSVEKLLKLIINEFKCFRDEADFYDHRVSFYKRAQILIGDIWACYKGKDLGEFIDIDKITMFADYRVPQVLMHFGAMKYSDSLLKTLQTGTELAAGCTDEIEIRGCSIEIVERVVNQVQKMIRDNSQLNNDSTIFNSIVVDHFLWDYRRKHAKELEYLPYHKVRCIYY